MKKKMLINNFYNKIYTFRPTINKCQCESNKRIKIHYIVINLETDLRNKNLNFCDFSTF